jgi:hypothetical protein
MLKKRKLTLIAFSILASARAVAGTEAGFGLNLISFSYEEELAAPAKSTENGTIAALSATIKTSASGLGANGFVDFNGEATINANTTYDGTSLSTGSAASATDQHTFVRLETNAYLSVSDNIFLHLGYGYRYWKRYLTYGSGYREVYTWSYIPLGFLISQNISPTIRMGFDYSYRLMMSGKIQVLFSETVTNGEDSNLDLGNRPGYRISFPVDFSLKGYMKFQLRPWYEHTEIGESNSVVNNTPYANPDGSGILGLIHEPSSKTEQIGLMFTLFY